MRYLIILVFSLLSLSGFSQTGGVKPPPPPSTPALVEPETVAEGQDEVLTMASVQQKPVFPGGDEALFKYIAENIKYPSIAKENGIQGKVMVSLVVSKSGQISAVQIIRGIGGGCDPEAVRVVKNMPNWSPGKHNGLPVNVKYTLPVSFKLENYAIVYMEDQVDKKASFTGGEDAKNMHLARNISYPPTAKEKGIQGKVIVRFEVDANGKASNHTVIQSVSVECDANALMSVKSLPNTWNPAELGGKPVSSYVFIPCTFSLVGKN